MSIETTLERIATALETIAGKPAAVVNVVPTAETKPTTARKPATKPVEKPETPPAETQKLVAQEEPEPDPLDTPPPAEDAPEFTLDDVRAALKAYRDIEGSAAMMEVLKNHGAENMSGLKPERYAEVMAIIK